MALNSGKILMRRGQEANFDPNKMMPGEWAVSLDSKFVRMCFSPGVCIRMATYEAFEADMEQIREILAECETVEEAVQRIYEDIKDVAVDVERIEAAAAIALESEKNALNSANLAVQSANTATQKASEAAESANIASTKAEQATEGANTATQKASEAAESAGNVRNMSEVSQSYAVGGTGTREGEDADNAKYYNQQASDNADRAEAAAERASAVADVGVATTEKAGLVKPDGRTIKVSADGTIEGIKSYSDLEEKPKINDIELNGNKTLDELGIASNENLKKTDDKVNIIIENAELRFKETASGENIHLNDSADSKLVEFSLCGKATQDGTPTPQNPVDIKVAGASGSVEAKSVGKNLLPYPYDETTHTESGVTWTDNNGVITTKGTATEMNDFLFISASTPKLLKKGTYILSGCPSGGELDKTYFLLLGKVVNGKASRIVSDTGSGATFTLNEDTTIYLVGRFIAGTNAEGFTFKPMIRLASDTDNTWEAYKGKTATIQTENGLAGIPVDSGGNYTDSNGQQWICDEVVKYADGSGEYIKRVGNVIFDGSSDESWGKSGIASNISYYISKTTSGSFNAGDGGLGLLCNRFQVFKTKDLVEKDTVGCSYGYEGRGELRIGLGLSSEVNTVDLFKTWLSNNPVKMVYQLKTPSRTPLTAEQLAEIEKLSTFYPVTNILNDGGCGMKVKYIADPKSYIDNRLNSIEQAILNSI